MEKISYLNLAIGIIALILLGYILYNSSFNSKSLKPDTAKLPAKNKSILGTIGIEEAAKMIEAYRSSITFYKMAYLSGYSPGDILNYIDVFKKTTTQGLPSYLQPPEDFTWHLASSLMFVLDENNDVRLTICLLPTLIHDNNKKNVYDFFIERKKNSAIFIDYFDKLNSAFILESGNKFKSFIYDEGNLWP